MGSWILQCENPPPGTRQREKTVEQKKEKGCLSFWVHSHGGVRLKKKFVMTVLALSAMVASPLLAKDMYGALAYSKADGAWGWWADATTQAAASKNALAKCSEHSSGCEVVLEFWNTCAAFATGSGGSYGWAHGPDENQVQSKAVDFCSEHGSGCEVRVWACTSR